MNTLIIIAALGLTDLIVDSVMGGKIKALLRTDRVPFLAELLSCKQCTSFWAGLAISLIYDPTWSFAYACAVPCVQAVWQSISDYLLLRS